MRLADFIQVFEPHYDERTTGVTIDVAAGIVAGLALVLALLLLSSTLKITPAQAGEASGPYRMDTGSPTAVLGTSVR